MLKLACWIVALAAATASLGDVIHLKDGRKVEGEIVQRRPDAVVIKVMGTIRMTVRTADIKSIEESAYTHKSPKPKPTPPKPTKPTDDPATGNKKTVSSLAIVGPIEVDMMAMGIKRSLAQAKRHHTDVLLIELDTPGGRIDLMEQICEAIEDSGIQTVAYVRKGSSRGAFSAGAIIAMACDHIYMAPATSIGAATPMIITSTGAAKIDEKMISAFSAIARNIASRHKHTPALAAAMVDPDVELRLATVDGKPTLVGPGEADELRRKGAKLGRYVSRAGKLLTLTAAEAKEVGLIAAVADSRKDVMAHMGVEVTRFHDLKTHETLQKATAKREADIQKLRTRLQTEWTKASSQRPENYTYTVRPSGRFVDGGRDWRARSAASVKAYDNILALCRLALKMCKKYPDLAHEEQAIKDVMVKIKTERDMVYNNRTRKGR